MSSWPMHVSTPLVLYFLEQIEHGNSKNTKHINHIHELSPEKIFHLLQDDCNIM